MDGQSKKTSKYHFTIHFFVSAIVSSILPCPVHVLLYSKTVLGCKENCRYEMDVQKDFLRHPSSIDDLPATSHCFAIIIYLISPINRELMQIYQADQSGPDQMLLPALT